MIKEGVITFKKWNKSIVPLVEAGKLKDVSYKLPKGFLMFGQIMEALIQDIDDSIYRCIAWAPPSKSSIGWVSIARWNGIS